MSTRAPPPAKKPNATPELRTWTSFTPGRNLCTSPTAIPETTACLVIRSTTRTIATTASARANATRRRAGDSFAFVVVIDIDPRKSGSADYVDDDPLRDVQDDDRDHRREVEVADRRQQAPEKPQIRVADVLEEGHKSIRPARVRRAQAEGRR